MARMFDAPVRDERLNVLLVGVREPRGKVGDERGRIERLANNEVSLGRSEVVHSWDHARESTCLWSYIPKVDLVGLALDDGSG
jgi:hypothetical protein